MSNTHSYSVSMKQALKLLAKREYSRRLLLDKLLKKSSDFEACQQVLNALEKQGFLSDQRFANAFVRDATIKLRGPLRIRSELEHKGLAPDIISSSLSEVDNWSVIAQSSAQKKVKYDDVLDCLNNEQLDTLLQVKRQKVMAHLAYQGFDYETSEHVADKLQANYMTY